jgi:hypothetical protein
MSSYKTSFKEALRQILICLRPRTHTHPINTYCTLYTCMPYTSFTQGRGELDQREGSRAYSSQIWVEVTNMTDYTSSL